MDKNLQINASSGSSMYTGSYQGEGEPRWQPLIDQPLRSRTLEAVQLLAERLCEPEKVLALVEQDKILQIPNGLHWSPPTLLCGFGSLVLLYLYLARNFPGQGWEDRVDLYLRLAAEDTHQKPLSQPALFNGSSGLAWLVALLSQNDTRYQKLCSKLNVQVATQVLMQQWRRATPGVADADYDVVSGASGILSTLIATQGQQAIVEEAIQKLLIYLVWLANGEDEQKRKNWFASADLFPLEHIREQYPRGYFNVGLAHGIPGPLAVLSLAWNAGYRIAGQREAIEGISRWIIEHHVKDSWGINWPGVVPLSASYSAEEWRRLHPARSGWCYGVPGVARSLWLAWTVLKDETLRDIALESMETVLSRPIDARNIYSPTLCHGIGGLLTVCLHFAHETKNPIICEHVPVLVNQMLSVCSPKYLLGVRDEKTKGKFVDDPGFLTGSTGVALALLAASTSVAPAWGRVLLIA